MSIVTAAHAQVPPPAPPVDAPPPASAAPPAQPAPAQPAPAEPAPAQPLPPPQPPPPAPAQGVADPASSTAASAPAYATPPGATVHTHDGFYLRLGLGVGNFAYETEIEQTGVKVATAETSTIVPMSEIAIGGTLAPGLVLGGGIYTAGTAGGSMDFDFTLEGSGGSSTEELDTGPFGIVGPFIDYYVNPEQGLHCQAAIGYAVFTITEPETESVDDVTVSGPGVMLGIGYEWWIGEQWSFGVLGRVMAASLSGEDPSDSEEKYAGTAIAPGVLATITYH